jgi:TPR repeat protein
VAESFRTIGLLEQQLLFSPYQSSERSLLLGFLHYTGGSLPQDYAMALGCFREAAAAGSVWAEHALGVMHESGHGVDKNLQNAIEWYGRAAQKDHVPAICALALIYKFGPDEFRDQSKAIGLLDVAARAGSSLAALELADSFERGLGTAPDADAARGWYFRAAELSDESTAAAHAALATIYRTGRLGVPRDEEKAERWYTSSQDFLKKIQLLVRREQQGQQT